MCIYITLKEKDKTEDLPKRKDQSEMHFKTHTMLDYGLGHLAHDEVPSGKFKAKNLLVPSLVHVLPARARGR